MLHMELRALFAVVARRWPLVVIPAAIAVAVALATARPPAPTYTTGMRFTAGQRAAPETPAAGYDPNYNRWQTSEYIVNGLRDWVRSAAFATAVSEELAARNIAISPAALIGHIRADSAQTLLAVYVSWSDREQTQAIAEAAVVVLQTRNGQAFPQLGSQPAEIAPMDTPVILPVIETAVPPVQARLAVPLRVGLGLAAGLALAFVVDYLDPTVRDRRELEEMGLRVVGEIPHRARWRGRQGQ
jgi:capsular polysaccharide biosynthesis protein